MNKAIFSGRLGNTPELRYTKSGIAVCSFTLAVERPRQKDKEEETDWPTIIAWRSKAEFAAKYLTKGRKVLVTATVRTRTYDGEDGKKHKITEFYAEDIEFCDKKPQQDAAGTYAASSQELPDGFEEIEVPDEDLPF